MDLEVKFSIFNNYICMGGGGGQQAGGPSEGGDGGSGGGGGSGDVFRWFRNTYLQLDPTTR